MSDSQSSSSSAQTCTVGHQVDPRGPRFGAAITALVLILALLFGPSSPVTLGLLIAQTIAFALGGLAGLQYQPYGYVYAKVVRPRLQPPTELEDVRPPQFAQLVGLIFALLGLIGFLAGISVLFYVAVILALAAALLNAVFNFCLGCEIYLLAARLGKRA